MLAGGGTLRFRHFGKTGFRVSEVGLGAFPISGRWTDAQERSVGWTGVEDDESVRLIHRAEELGVNLIDTAESYGNGHSETVVGRALAGRRHRWIIATKVSPNQGLRPDRPDRVAARRRVEEAVAGSLRRLATDVIDLYQLHAIPFDWATETVVGTLESLRESGKIRAWGISTDDLSAVERLLELGRVEALQVRYNLIQRKSEGLLKFAQERGIGTLIRVPLAKGLLTGKYPPGAILPTDDVRGDRFALPEVQNALRIVPGFSFLADGTGRTMTQAALRFVLDNPAVSCVIAGAKMTAQLEENAATSEVAALSSRESRRAAEVASAVDIGEIF